MGSVANRLPGLGLIGTSTVKVRRLQTSTLMSTFYFTIWFALCTSHHVLLLHQTCFPQLQETDQPSNRISDKLCTGPDPEAAFLRVKAEVCTGFPAAYIPNLLEVCSGVVSVLLHYILTFHMPYQTYVRIKGSRDQGIKESKDQRI